MIDMETAEKIKLDDNVVYDILDKICQHTHPISITRIEFKLSDNLDSVATKTKILGGSSERIQVGDDPQDTMLLTLVNNELSIVTTKVVSYECCEEQLFKRMPYMTSVDIKNVYFGNLVNADFLFTSCMCLKEIDLSNADLSRVTSMEEMFRRCKELKVLKLDNIKSPTNLCNMKSMFAGCESIETIDISAINTEHVTTFESTFMGCYKLKNIKWNLNTNRAYDFSYMFTSCKSLESIDLTGLHADTEAERHFSFFNMFYDCHKLKNVKLDTIIIRKAKSVSLDSMFENCEMLESVNTENLDIFNASNARCMFAYCEHLTKVDLSNLSLVFTKAMGCMFYNCKELQHVKFNKVSIKYRLWDVAEKGLIDADHIFSGCEKLHNNDVAELKEIATGCIFD